MTTSGDRSSLPILTIDLDGVLCQPPLGINMGISETFLDPTFEPRPARVPPHWLSSTADPLRFNLRRPLPEAWSALGMLRPVRQLVILTGRRSSPGWWLRRHRLLTLVDRVVVNESALRSPHYKLRELEALGAADHIDDDGRTAQLLAQRGSARVFLRDWPRNRNAAYDGRVIRVPDIFQLALLLRSEAEQAGVVLDAVEPAAHGDGLPPRA